MSENRVKLGILANIFFTNYNFPHMIMYSHLMSVFWYLLLVRCEILLYVKKKKNILTSIFVFLTCFLEIKYIAIKAQLLVELRVSVLKER